MKIREINLPSKIIIAPMAGVSNHAFRKVYRKYTKGLICAEMVSDKAILYRNEKTLNMINVDKDEGMVSMQVFGGEVDNIVNAAKFIDENSNATFIDINMGCPVKKVLKTGGGSNLLKYPDKVKEIVTKVVNNVSKPVTVKIRAGFDFDSINYLEIGQIIQDSGASAITIHGRTRSQFYEGKANWDYIKDLKEHLDIPVIGNGDIQSVDDAIKMLEYTKCDAIMIGRGILGNPWLAKEIEYYLETGNRLEAPSYQEKINQAIEHLDLLVQEYGNKIGVTSMRSHGAWYLKGLSENARVRQALNTENTYEGMKKIFEDYIIFLDNKKQ
ncbi:tRNA dihydrouridine synthase DusB [Mycoplasma sp. P36-A1]|uniref:tRNA dihydrouridine synthase DusB n=1 Tax=Mycoplasma sp. P36-A1 TaxID=3252900 RepID=UPI003C2D5BE1